MSIIIYLLSFYVLILQQGVFSHPWHFYNTKQTSDSTCDALRESERSFYEKYPTSPNDVTTWKTWPNGAMSGYDKKYGESLVGFNFAMSAIWKNQNPPDCSKAKYAISHGYDSGFGSEFHVESAGLVSCFVSYYRSVAGIIFVLHLA